MYHSHCQHHMHQLMPKNVIYWVGGAGGVKYHLREGLHDQQNGLTQDAIFYETWNVFLGLETFSPPFLFQHIVPISHPSPTFNPGFSYFCLIFPTPTQAAPKSTTVNVCEEFASAESLKVAKMSKYGGRGQKKKAKKTTVWVSSIHKKKSLKWWRTCSQSAKAKHIFLLLLSIISWAQLPLWLTLSNTLFPR